MSQQKVAFDSCVVIRVLERPGVAAKIKARLRGKSVRIVLPDVVLDEVRRVRGHLPATVVSRLSGIFGKKISVSSGNRDTVPTRQNREV